ncbi:hypothetical protein HID58_073882, partial [Brassica napus]
VKLFHIRKYGRFSLSEVFHFMEGSSVPGTELEGPGAFLYRGPEGLGPAWRLEEMIPGRGITCALKSTGVAHSQQAPLRQDPVPSVLLAWVPLKPEFVLNPGEDRFLRVTSPSLSPTFRFFLPSAPEMRTEAGLSPDSSSIGSTVRSSRLRVDPTKSMDSFDCSLDLTAKEKNPKAISFTGRGSRYPPIGPPSVIGAEEVSFWRKKYELPDDVAIRVPDPENRVSDFGVDEVPVYEGYFPSGFRDHIPSLVAKISETLGISPGQLDPPAWRTLIALQNLGVLNGLGIGVAEVMCSYSVSPLSGTEWRYYHLRPRGKEPPVREILKKERKRLPDFEGNWTEKFAFMHLPVFSSIWRLEDFPRVDYSSGKDTIEQVLKLPLERRQIPFLLSKAALKRCSIRGEMSGSKGDEALAEYKKALEVMSARKAAPKRVAPTEDC